MERIAVLSNFIGNSVGYFGSFPSVQDYICFILHFVVDFCHPSYMQRFQNTNADVYFDFMCLLEYESCTLLSRNALQHLFTVRSGYELCLSCCLEPAEFCRCFLRLFFLTSLAIALRIRLELKPFFAVM